MPSAPELQQGTLDLLILKTLARGPLHGWGISKFLRETTREVLQVQQGSLYPALYRLEDQGLILPQWGVSPEGRRAKFYRLSAAGRRRLDQEAEAWRIYSGAVNLVLRTA